MRWSERQLAMLREMGIPPFWPQARADAEPGAPVAVAEVAQVAQVAQLAERSPTAHREAETAKAHRG